MPQIGQDVLKVLDAATISGSLLTLNGKLDRKLYSDTNKVLEAAGGKWNRKLGAHSFEGQAADVIEPIMLTGEYSRTKQDFGQFDTPQSLAAEVVTMAGIERGMVVLEPSAGIGNIAAEVEVAGGKLACYEIDSARAAKLYQRLSSFATVSCRDFLTIPPLALYDRVVMNPPFAKQADIQHVMHAFDFLKPGGKLVAIMSSSVMFRENRLTKEFRDFAADNGGELKMLPEGSFKESGTGVNTCIVTLTKS